MIRTSTAMAKKPLCPLIMKGYPIIFLELTVSSSLALGCKTLLAGTVSFEGALLGHLAFRVIYLTFTHPGYLYSWSQKTQKLFYSFLVLLLLVQQFGANTEHTITPSHKSATCIMLYEEDVSVDSFIQPQVTTCHLLHVSMDSFFGFTQPQPWVTTCHLLH